MEKTLDIEGACGATTRTPGIADSAASANSRSVGSSIVKFSSATEAAINKGNENVPGDLIGAICGSGYEYWLLFLIASIAKPPGPFQERASNRAVSQRSGSSILEPVDVASIAT